MYTLEGQGRPWVGFCKRQNHQPGHVVLSRQSLLALRAFATEISMRLGEVLGWQGSASERLSVTMLIKTYLVLRMVMSRLSTVEVVFVNEVLLTLHSILVHLLQELHAQFDICDERLASASCEVLPHHHTEHLEILSLRGHRVRRYDPAPDAQLRISLASAIRGHPETKEQGPHGSSKRTWCASANSSYDLSSAESGSKRKATLQK